MRLQYPFPMNASAKMLQRGLRWVLAAYATADISTVGFHLTDTSLSIGALGGPWLFVQQLVLLVSHLNIAQTDSEIAICLNTNLLKALAGFSEVVPKKTRNVPTGALETLV